MSDRKLRAAAVPQRARFVCGIERAALGALVGTASLVGASAPADAFFFFDSPPPRAATPSARPTQPRGANPDANSNRNNPAAAAKKKRKPAPVMRVKVLTEEEKRKTHAEFIKAAKSGPLIAAVSLARQELTLYANGVEIARSRISSGVAQHRTPTGVFSILQKNLFHRSNLYSAAPMPYMQRITWSGVALHQGVVPNHPASHGCIRMPDEFARKLWEVTDLGMRVVVTRAPVAVLPFSHDALFKLPSKDEQTPAQVQNDQGAAPVQVASVGSPTATDALQNTVGDGGLRIEPASLRKGPIMVLVSRREGRVFVRKGRAPVFDAPITIDRPEQPIGTHLYTAMGTKPDGSLNWHVLSMPSYQTEDEPVVRQASATRKSKRGKRGADVEPAAVPPPSPAGDLKGATEALERIGIPAEALAQITRLMTPGASLLITDHGIGRETGRETDFIVETTEYGPLKPINVTPPKPKNTAVAGNDSRSGNNNRGGSNGRYGYPPGPDTNPRRSFFFFGGGDSY